jgi:uncharacterized membrane protein YkoI
MRMLDIVPGTVALTGVCLLMLLLALALPVQAAENLPVQAAQNLPDLKDPRNALSPISEDNANGRVQQPRISRRQASNIASSRYEGRVLSILMDDNTNQWRVRMDRDGTVFNVFVHAASGDVNASSD